VLAADNWNVGLPVYRAFPAVHFQQGQSRLQLLILYTMVECDWTSIAVCSDSSTCRPISLAYCSSSHLFVKRCSSWLSLFVGNTISIFSTGIVESWNVHNHISWQFIQQFFSSSSCIIATISSISAFPLCARRFLTVVYHPHKSAPLSYGTLIVLAAAKSSAV